jgi:hypothetical protein
VDRATGQVVAAPVAEAVETSPRAAFRSWTAEDIGGLFGGGRRAAVPAAVVADAPVVAGAPVAEVVGETKPSLLDQVRGAFTSARSAPAPVVGEVAGEVVAETPKVAKPSLLEQLRGVGTTLRGPAANGAAEVVEEAAPKAPKGLAAIREGLSGLGALRHAAPAAEVVEEAVTHTPNLAERAVEAFRFASKVR